MSEEIELTPKVKCGVWTAIENFLNKESNEKIWDNKDIPPKTPVSRKKEKCRARGDLANVFVMVNRDYFRGLIYMNRKFLPPVISLETHYKGSSSRRGSTRVSSARNTNAIASAFAHKALVIRNIKNEHAQEVFERSKQLLQTCNIPDIDCRYLINTYN